MLNVDGALTLNQSFLANGSVFFLSPFLPFDNLLFFPTAILAVDVEKEGDRWSQLAVVSSGSQDAVGLNSLRFQCAGNPMLWKSWQQVNGLCFQSQSGKQPHAVLDDAAC